MFGRALEGMSFTSARNWWEVKTFIMDSKQEK